LIYEVSVTNRFTGTIRHTGCRAGARQSNPTGDSEKIQQLLQRIDQSAATQKSMPLEPSHLKELAKWVEVGAALVMDAGKAAELGKKIAAL
jgi:hypothetical protein